MARPNYKQIYESNHGSVDGPIPSVTQILSRFKDSGGLIYWAWRQGSEGKDFRQTRDAAADAGTLAHKMVEADIRGHEPPSSDGVPLEVWENAVSAFGSYVSWKSLCRLTPTDTELALTCACHRFGGTLDAMMIDDKLALGDWKTSGHTYVDYLCQLAAYGHLWEMNFPDRPIDGGYHLVRFSKENGDFHHDHWPRLDLAWRQFEIFREAFSNDKELKGRL